MNDPPDHAYRGARALVALHDAELRRFLSTWEHARERELALPATDDPDYASLAALLRHVVGCAAGYMRWTCEQLGLADPGFRSLPAVEVIEAEVDGYVDHVLERWRSPLREVPGERFEEAFASSWGTPYSIDAMLEHAVMHPVRHRFQLEGLLGG